MKSKGTSNLRCPHCGSSNTRKRYRRHRHHNRRCRNCGRTFRGHSFPNVGFILILLMFAAVGGSIYYFKPKEPMELEPLPQMPEDTVVLEWESHRMINEIRIEQGRRLLIWDSSLAEIARAHSSDMMKNGFFSHDNLKGQDPTDRGMIAGYPCRKSRSIGLGENILMGYLSQSTNPFIIVRAWWNNQSADDLRLRERAKNQIDEAKIAVQRWMDSPGHRGNILDSHYDRSGIGAAFQDGTYYLTQNFC